jgi:hypothetical protein
MRDWLVMIIPPDDEPYNAVWELPDTDKPNELYRALKAKVEDITGPPMEHVNVFSNFQFGEFRYRDMFVNELGHLTDPKLPLNRLATAIYRNNVLTHEPGRFQADELPTIVGAAVLFEGKVWF